MGTMTKTKTSIGVTPETLERISRHGRFKESMEDVIKRILDFYENAQAKGRVKSDTTQARAKGANIVK